MRRPDASTDQRRRVVGHRTIDRCCVVVRRSRDRLQDQRAVPRGAGHGSDGVEAVPERYHAGLRNEAIRGLEPGDATQRRRNAHAPASVSTESSEDQTRGNAGSGARTRTAGPPLEVPWVAVDRKRAVGIGRAHGELHRGGLPGDDRTLRAQAGDHRRVDAASPLRIEHLAARGGRTFARRDDVLHTERNALQRTAIDTRRKVRVGLRRRGERGVVEAGDVGPERRVVSIGAREQRPRELDARQCAAAQCNRGVRDGGRQVGVHFASRFT